MDDGEANRPDAAADGSSVTGGTPDTAPTVPVRPARSGPGGDTVPLGDERAPHSDVPVGDPDATRPVAPLSESFVAPHLMTGLGDPDTDETRPLAPDRTQALPQVGGDPTQRLPEAGGGPTRALPPLRSAAGTTSVFPQGQVPPYRRQAGDATAVGAPVPDGWKGQAAVRRQDGVDEDSGQWGEAPPNRTWWLPILFGFAGLVLILAIAYALVVATRGHNSPAPAPSPTPSTAPSTSAPPSAPPSAPSTPPSAPPSEPPSGAIAIPTVLLSGIDRDAAVQTLESIGLKADPQPQIDPTHAENTVIGTFPTVGALVQPGTVVTLYYAVPPPSSPPPSGPASGPPSGTVTTPPSAGQSS